ncbi:MAG: nucleotidyl transferase AbiEii/AbiGii toxin family protein [Thermaerobacter sp.]|nr:nucleotidyl transferase AbiEii/AbiGii toxin family protein [Thermaerobacter sp.]
METWERLFERAMACLDSIPLAKVPPPRWSFGGGTALRLQIGHRDSHDIDIFLEGPQWLSVLSPRLNDTVSALCQDYEEDTQFVKLVMTEGEVDFIAAPLLTSPGVFPQQIGGRTVSLETPAEIIAKKLFFRGGLLRPRDVLDIAAVWRFDRAGLLSSVDAWISKAGEIAQRLTTLRANPVQFDARVAELRLLPPGEAVRASALDFFADFLNAAQRARQ